MAASACGLGKAAVLHFHDPVEYIQRADVLRDDN